MLHAPSPSTALTSHVDSATPQVRLLEPLTPTLVLEERPGVTVVAFPTLNVIAYRRDRNPGALVFRMSAGRASVRVHFMALIPAPRYAAALPSSVTLKTPADVAHAKLRALRRPVIKQS